MTGGGCPLSGLPEGVPQHFEVVAVYRGPGGAELRSRLEPISVIPRGEAKPNGKLKVTATVAGRPGAGPDDLAADRQLRCQDHADAMPSRPGRSAR